MLLVTTVVLPFEGKLMATKDLRVVLSGAVFCIGLPLIAMSFFTAVWQFYIAGAFLGVGLAALLVLSVPTLINRWFRTKVGFYIGLCMAFTGIGGVVFNLIGGSIIATGPEGWRTAYMVFGVLALVMALPFTLFGVRSNPSDVGLEPVGAAEAAAAAAASGASQAAGVKSSVAMKSAAFFLIAIFAGVINLSINFYQYLPTYAASLTEFPDVVAISATLASAAMLGQAIGKVALGMINDKFGAFAGLYVSTGCGAAGMAIMWLVPGSVPAMLAGGFVFGVFYASATVLTPLIVRSVFGTLDYSIIYSRVAMVASLCGAFATSAWGFLIDGTSFTLAFCVGISGAILVAIVGTLGMKAGKKLIWE